MEPYEHTPMRRATDRPQKTYRKGMYILPSLATTLNMALGYYAIWHTFAGSVAEPWHFDNAAKAIGFAIVADGLDGRIARMTNTTSDFGREFDSLADVVTFGVAPALLAWVWGFHELGSVSGSGALARVVQVGAITTFAFLIAGASRLARFNIQKNPQPTNPGRPGRKYFVGMPIPAGAGVVAAVVHFFGGYPIMTWWFALVWAALVFATALVMVSRWRFYSFKDIDLRSRRPFRLVLIIAMLIAGIWYFSQIVLLVLALGYMFSGILSRFTWSLRRGSDPAYREEASELR